MSVAGWLAELGLERYSQAFADHDVDEEVLAFLTLEDLKDIGIASVGHRRKILVAIARMNGLDPLGSSQPAALPAEVLSESKTGNPQRGERRQVTVLFADITGFTSLSERLGAEATHNLLSRYFAQADGVIEAFGGHVDKHIGDAVMAIFGAPVAHDNDPERAARAALELHKIGAGLDPPIELHAGIASGQVVAGGLGEGAAESYTMTGDSVNLAARLTDLAETGETLISGALQAALASQVFAEELGSKDIKGLAEPVSVWRLDGMRESETEGGPFVGREFECSQIEAALRDCISGNAGRAILLRGEAGIGKTRLLDEISARAGAMGFSCHRARVMDFGSLADRDATGQLFRSLLELSRAGDAAATLPRLQVIGQEMDFKQSQVTMLHELVGSPIPEALRGLNEAMDRSAREETIRGVKTDLLRYFTDQAPRLIMIEDLHWAEAGQLRQLRDLARLSREMGMVVLFSSRSQNEWRESFEWEGVLALTLDLGPLRQDEAADLAKAYPSLSQAQIEACLARANGNPLFLEQLLSNVGSLDESGLPGSVQSLVQARLDRLPLAERSSLQAAAVLGLGFSFDALVALMSGAGEEAENLVRDGLLRKEGPGLAFVHTLIRDGAYAMLLKEERQRLHLAAAEYFSDDVALRAVHLGRADDPAAVEAFEQAAREALGYYRFEQAIELARGGLALELNGKQRASLLMLLAQAQRDGGEPAGAMAAFEEALELAEDEMVRCRVLIAMAAAKRLLGEPEEGMALIDEAEDLAARAEASEELSQIAFFRGNFHFAGGNIAACQAVHEQGLEQARRAGNAELEARALSGLGDAAYAAGRIVTSDQYFQTCFEICRREGFDHIEIANRLMVIVFRRYMGDLFGAREKLQDYVMELRALGLRRALLLGVMQLGEVTMESGDSKSAAGLLEESVEIAKGLGNQRMVSYCQSDLARACLHLDQIDRSKSLLDSSWSISKATSPVFFGPRICGMWALVADQPEERREWITKGEALLAEGCLAHNHFWFRRDAMDAALGLGDWDLAEAQAKALADYTQAEAVPWCDFLINRARALAAAGRGDPDPSRLQALTDEAQSSGHILLQPALKAALSALQS